MSYRADWLEKHLEWIGPQFPDHSVMERLKKPLNASFGLRRVGGDEGDVQSFQEVSQVGTRLQTPKLLLPRGLFWTSVK